VSVPNLAAGALGWWLILLILSAIYLPGASYLLLWPLVFGLIGLWLALVSKAPAAAEGEPKILSTSFYLSLFAIPGVVLVVPLIPLVFAGLGLEWSALLMVVAVLLLGLIVPHLSLLSGARKWMLPGGLAVAALALIVLNVSTAAFDKSHPKQDHLFYGADATTGRNVWASFDKQPDGWTQQVFAARERGTLSEFQVAGGNFLKTDAPSIGLTPPEVTVLEDSTDGDLRRLRLHVKSSRQAPFINLQLNSNAELRRVEINGKSIEYAKSPLRVSDDKRWGLRYYALPPEGIDLSLEVKASEPLKVSVLDQSYGLPQIPGAPLRPRPDDMVPASAAYSDATLATKSFVF
jgi:hypothetical protein